MSSSVRSPLALLVGAGVLWGTGGVTGRALADATGLSAPAVAAYRLGLGGLLLVALLLARRAPAPRTRAAWARIGAVGALAATFQGLYFGAVVVGTVSVATLVAIGTAPVVVVAAGAARARRWPGAATLRPVGLGLAGLVALVGVPAGGTSAGTAVLGGGLAAASGTAFAAFTLLGRRPLVGVDAPTVTGYGFLLGGLLLTPVAAATGGLAFTPTAPAAGLLVLFATVPTAVAYTLFVAGLRGAGASTAAVVALLEPLTGTVLAVVLLGDRLGPVGLVGAALLLASVVDVGRARPGAVT